MPVYVDECRWSYGRMKMCHMTADSLQELVDMADKIGVARKWFQPGSLPHFDICKSKREKAVREGACEVSSKELVKAGRNLVAKITSETDEHQFYLELRNRCAKVNS